MKSITPLLKNWTDQVPCKRDLLLIALVLALSALSPTAQAEDGDLGNGNTAEGNAALLQVTTGGFNTAIGLEALYSTKDGSLNTAEGAFALFSNISGTLNTANGYEALGKNRTASRNTATGAHALLSNNDINDTNNAANDNTADGFDALYNNASGTRNTATGSDALSDNFNGNDNTADGFAALLSNGTGFSNTATGSGALSTNTIHSYNTATGFQALNLADADDNTALGALALSSDSSGYYNTATGVSALFSNTTGYYNVANGVSALHFNVGGHDNVAVGLQALLTNKGSNNIGLGSNAGINLTTGNNNIDIGANVTGMASEANTIRIGKSGTQQKTFVAGIYGKTVASGVGVIINSQGQLGTMQSSARFKDDIKPMDKASEALLKLKPVTFRYKEELDPDKIPQFGLIAEEVEKVNPDLVVRDEDGNVTTVRYEAVNAMLLNEFLKEHHKVEHQEAAIAQLEASAAAQQRQIEALTARVQKANSWSKLDGRASKMLHHRSAAAAPRDPDRIVSQR